uniref:hypothetical protein n=1 Tax=Paraburkholderia sp. RL18-101-BIB-B TaxID=3031634 RepID=UPI0038B76A9E
MDKITRIGVDLAKNIIQVHGVDSMKRVVVRKAISRQKFPEWFANLEPCLVAMEACSAAHYWGRKLQALGHKVRLIAPDRAAVGRAVSQRRQAREERQAGCRGHLRGRGPAAYALRGRQNAGPAKRAGAAPDAGRFR